MASGVGDDGAVGTQQGQQQQQLHTPQPSPSASGAFRHYAYPRQPPVRSLLKSDGGSDGSGGKEEEPGKGRPPGDLSMGREGNPLSRRAPCRKPQISV